MALNRVQFAARPHRRIVQNIIRISTGSSHDLADYLNSLSLEELRRIIALMYLGRGDARTFEGLLSLPLDCYSSKKSATQKLLEKQPRLMLLLERGLEKFDATSLDG